MKKLFSSTKAYLLLAGAAALMASCQDYEPANEQMTKEAAYNYEFERQFGPVDPNHDWSMATRVTANIDLSDAPEGTYEVKIFSEKNGYLLAKAIVDGSAQIGFDAIKGESHVRILARKTSALGLAVINGYFQIEDGKVSTVSGTRASTADNCQTTVGAQITDLGTYSYNTNGYVFQDFNYGSGLDLSNYAVQPWTEVPSDGGYYITQKEGEFVSGGNGIYLVTHNGVAKEYDMVEIADLINQGVSFTYYWYANNEYRSPYFFYPAYYRLEANKTYTYAGNFYYLNDVYKNIDPNTKVAFTDLAEIVSPAYPNTYFTEGIDNRSLYEDKFDYDVEYILKDNGPITFTPVFSGTNYNNQMGYFYWRETDDMTEEQKKEARLNAPRYVFLDNTFPNYVVPETGQANIVCNDNEVPVPMQMPSWVGTTDAIAAHDGHYVQGTTYHLAYFGDNYDQPVGSYVFPEGLHVGFFMFAGHHVVWADEANNIASNRGQGLFYSIQEMNMEYDKMLDYGTNFKHWWAAETNGHYDPSEERLDVGEVAAVTYSYKGTIVVGFEDDVDKDENDVLFFVTAPIDPPHEIVEREEQEMSWLVACEDLGGTFDYDFNDLVFDLGELNTTYTSIINSATGSSSSTSMSAELFLRPLAAGGTKPAYIYYGDELIGEVHALLAGEGASTAVPINVNAVGGISVDPTTIERIKLADVEEPYTEEESIKSYIAAELAKIRIVVDDPDNSVEAYEITAPDYNKSVVPQMLLLPRGWDWPNEFVDIRDVYPSFASWVESAEKNGWITTPQGDYHTNPMK